jgi:cytochrome P450
LSEAVHTIIAGGLHALIENPAELAKLRHAPELLNTAVEEMLRWTSPVKHFFRTATEDYQLRGRQIRAGDALMMCFPSANRDEEVFDHPFTFKVDRTPNRHIAFGHGVHQCLGLNLARMELKALFKELLARVHPIELAGEPAWAEANLVSGPKRLPIRYQMSKRAA